MCPLAALWWSGPPWGWAPPFALARGSLVLSALRFCPAGAKNTSGSARPGMLRPCAFVSYRVPRSHWWELLGGLRGCRVPSPHPRTLRWMCGPQAMHSPGQCRYQPLPQCDFTPRNLGLPPSVKYLQSPQQQPGRCPCLCLLPQHGSSWKRGSDVRARSCCHLAVLGSPAPWDGQPHHGGCWGGQAVSPTRSLCDPHDKHGPRGAGKDWWG